MAIDEHLTEHARGAMIGLAIGDALGMPTQSMSAEPLVPRPQPLHVARHRGGERRKPWRSMSV